MQEQSTDARPVGVAVTAGALRALRLTSEHGFELDAAAEDLVLRALVEDIADGVRTQAADLAVSFDVHVDRTYDHLGLVAVFPAAIDGTADATASDADWDEAMYAWELLLQRLGVGHDFTALPRTNEAIDAALAPPLVLDGVTAESSS